MSLDLTDDQNAVITYLGGQPTAIHETIPDDSALPIFSNGTIKPFLIYTFGPLTAATTGLTWMGEEYQPHQTFLILTAYAADKATARSVMNYNSKRLIGWRPSDNVSFFTAGTGRGYTIDVQDKPSRYAMEQVFRFSVNMASQTD